MLFEESVHRSKENPLPLAMDDFYLEDPFFPADPQVLIHNRRGFFRLKRVKIKGPINRLFNEFRLIHRDSVSPAASG